MKVLLLLLLAGAAHADPPFYPRGTATNQALGGINQNFLDQTTLNHNRLTTTITPGNCPPGQTLVGAFYNNGYTFGGTCSAAGAVGTSTKTLVAVYVSPVTNNNSYTVNLNSGGTSGGTLTFLGEMFPSTGTVGYMAAVQSAQAPGTPTNANNPTCSLNLAQNFPSSSTVIVSVVNNPADTNYKVGCTVLFMANVSQGAAGALVNTSTIVVAGTTDFLSSVTFHSSILVYSSANAGAFFGDGSHLTGVSAASVNLSTVTTQFNLVAVATTTLAANVVALGASTAALVSSSTAYLWVNGQNSMTGQLTVQSSVTVIGSNNMSVGGSVGIGTTSPATKLHISSGVVTIDGTSPGMVIGSAQSGTGMLKVGGAISLPVVNTGIFLESPQAKFGDGTYTGLGTSIDTGLESYASGNLILGNGTTPRVYITPASGYVGIANASPGTALDVTGTITATGGAVNGTLNVTSSATASSFFGDGSHLTGIASSGSLSGIYLPLSGGTLTGELVSTTDILVSTNANITSVGLNIRNQSNGTGASTQLSFTGDSSTNKDAYIAKNSGANVLGLGGSGALGISANVIALKAGTGANQNTNIGIVISSINLVGLGTNWPQARLHISSGALLIDGATSSVTASGYAIQYSSASGDTVFGVSGGGHIVSSGTIPTVSCGAGSPAMLADSNDMSGYFTAGALATTCTVTFKTAWTKKPSCVAATNAATPIALSVAPTTTQLVISAAGALTGDTINYICFGAP